MPYYIRLHQKLLHEAIKVWSPRRLKGVDFLYDKLLPLIQQASCRNLENQLGKFVPSSYYVISNEFSPISVVPFWYYLGGFGCGMFH